MIAIKRGNATIATVLPLSSSAQNKAVMGEENITLSWEQATCVELQIGDYIVYEGANWTLNSLPTVKKNSSRSFRYDAVFDSTKYELSKVIYMLFDNTDTPPQGEFPLNGTAETFVQLLVANLNRVAGTELWSVGDVVPDTEYVNLTFSNEDCLSVLGRLADEFDTEYHIDNRIVHLKRISTVRQITLQYGSTLYDLERTAVDSSSLTTRLYPFGSDRNIGSGYRGKTLLLPETEGSYISSNVNLYGVIEEAKTFDEVYPRLSSGNAGVVTAVGDEFTFTDVNLDFDVNSCLLNGTTAKVHFNTGECAGYDFDIRQYNANTKTFVIIATTEDNDFTLPTAQLKPKVGDKYVLLDVAMPASYISAAEAELLAKANEYLAQNHTPKTSYSVTFSEIYAKQHSQNIECGDTVTVIDPDLGINEQIRVVKLTKGIAERWKITLDLSNTVTKTTLQRIEGNVATLQNETIVTNDRINRNYRRAYMNTQELRDMVFDSDGYFDGGNIRPLSIETSMLSVGAKSQIFQLSSLLQPNYAGNPQVLRWTAGVLSHFTLAESIKEWILSAGSITISGSNQTKALYMYARCAKAGSTADIYLDAAALLPNADTTYYFFLIGVLHTPIDGVRGISLTYGQTTINGQFVTTGVIKSMDGATYFDLDTGEIGGNIKFLSTNNEYKSIPAAIAETTEYIDASVSGAEAEQASKGAQLVVNGTGLMLDNTNFSPMEFSTDSYNGSAGSFAYSGLVRKDFFCQKLIPVDTSRTYRIAFAAKSLNAKHKHYTFYDCLDADGLSIQAIHVMYVQNTLTTLAQELKNGDTAIYLTSAANWKDTTYSWQRGVIFWNYKNSAGYQYEPLTYSRNRHSNIYAANSSVNKSTGVITLSAAWSGGTIPAGTQLSQCSDGNQFNYFGLIGAVAPIAWNYYSKDVTGVNTTGKENLSKFRPGTAYIRFGGLWNFNSSTETDTLLITNVSVQDVTDMLDIATAQTTAEKLIGDEQLCVNSYVGELTIAAGVYKSFLSDKALKSNIYYTTILDVNAPTGGLVTIGGYSSGGTIPAGTNGIIVVKGKDSRTLSQYIGINNNGSSAITLRWMCSYEGDVKVPAEWRPSFLTEKPHIYDNLIVDSITRTVTGASGTSYAFLKVMNLENGKLYTFSGTPSIQATARIYALAAGTHIDDTGSVVIAAGTRGSMTFVVPDDGNVWTLLLYAGVAGATSGKTCTWTKLMLQRYNRASDWKPESETLAKALKGSTDISGGLVLTNLIMLRNANDNVTAGMSGMEDNVTMWGGGTYNQAKNQANNVQDTSGEVPILITETGYKSKIGVFRVIEDGIGIFGTDSSIILTNKLLSEISVDKSVSIDSQGILTYPDSLMVQAANDSASYSYNGRLPLTFDAANVREGYYNFDFSTKLAHVGLYMSLLDSAAATSNEGADLSVSFPTNMTITVVNNGTDIYTKQFTVSGDRSFNLCSAWDTSHDNLNASGEPPTVSYVPTDGVTSQQIYIAEGSVSIRIDCVVQLSMYNSKHLKLDAGLTYYNNQTGIRIESYFGVSLSTGNRHIIIAGNGIRVVDNNQNGDFVLKNDGTNLNLSLKGDTDIPGVLLAGSVSSGGAGYNLWGAKKHSTLNIQKYNNITGRYIIYHTIGHDRYSVQVTPRAANRTGFAETKGNIYCIVNMYSGTTLTDTDFDFMITGEN